MLGRRTNKPGRGVTEQGNEIPAFDRAGHTETTIAPPKLFLATSADEVAVPEQAEAILEAGNSTSPAAYHHHVLGSGPVSLTFSRDGDDYRSKGRRQWEAAARPVGLGLAGALNTGAATTILTGQYPARPGEMEASEDYTRVISHGPNARTVHIFHDHVGVDTGEFLKWCHSCSKDLAQGKDIFMYRSVQASFSLPIAYTLDKHR